MMVRKSISIAVLVSLAALAAACSDIAGPQPNGFCPITGGPGTCPTVSAQN